MFIALEGADCSGKDTLGSKLAEALKASLYRFPSHDRPFGKLCREHLAHGWECKDNTFTDPMLDALVFQGLQMADRLDHLGRIQRDLVSDRAVVAVRWMESGIVYGTLDGLSQKFLIEAQEGLPSPDLYVLLDVDIEDVKRRMTAQGRTPDRYESQLPFIEQVIREYRARWSIMSRQRGDASYVVIDASRPVDDVFKSLMDYTGSRTPFIR